MSHSSTIAGAPPTVVGVAHSRCLRSERERHPGRSWRRFAGWISALLADDGFNARFSAERQRDEGLVRRVERLHRP